MTRTSRLPAMERSATAPAVAASDHPRHRTVLGFDYGRRHIGVAVGQTLTGTATAIATVDRRGQGPDWEAIGRLIATWQPDALVVGEPLNMDDTEQAMTRAARRFARRLGGRFHLPVHGADERLTSREARERVGSTDDHAMAAQVILETWLGAETPAEGNRGLEAASRTRRESGG